MMLLLSSTVNGKRIFPEDRHFNLPAFATRFTRAVWWTCKYGTGLKSYSRYSLCFVSVLSCPAGTAGWLSVLETSRREPFAYSPLSWASYCLVLAGGLFPVNMHSHNNVTKFTSFMLFPQRKPVSWIHQTSLRAIMMPWNWVTFVRFLVTTSRPE